MIAEVAGDVDYVLVMSVNPGFGGQRFIPHSVAKIRAVRALLDAAGNAAPIEVDGGISLATVRDVVDAGAEILVAGNAIFGGGDAEGAARALKDAALAVREGARR
jgi:ribulose-phosphate 3-epimerase